MNRSVDVSRRCSAGMGTRAALSTPARGPSRLDARHGHPAGAWCVPPFPRTSDSRLAAQFEAPDASRASRTTIRTGWRTRCGVLVLLSASVLPFAACSSDDDAAAEQQSTAGCKSDSECPSGEVCGAKNGPRFGLPATFRVCWPAWCTQQPRAGCGLEGAPCGTFCSNQWPCSTDETCPEGQVCGSGNGMRFNDIQRDVCWAAGCETNPTATGCGTFDAACGVCP